MIMVQRFVFAVLITIASVTMASAATSAHDADNLFKEGNQFYKDANQAQAITAYEKIIQSGFANGEVYYNLGNSYVKTNQLGKAVLNYKRAQRIIPRDGDLKANYEFSLSLISDYSSPMNENYFRKVFGGIINFYSFGELLLVSLILIGLSGLLFLIGQYKVGPRSFQSVGVSVCLILGLVSSTGALFKFDQQKDEAVIIKKSDVRFEPLDNAKVYFEISEGMAVKIIVNEGGWIKIKRDDGRLGWVKKDALEEV